MSEHSTTTASPTRTEAELRTLMARAVREVRETNPLAPSITNTVTQSFVANAQLAVGGSAAMALPTLSLTACRWRGSPAARPS